MCRISHGGSEVSDAISPCPRDAGHLRGAGDLLGYLLVVALTATLMSGCAFYPWNPDPVDWTRGKTTGGA